VVSGFGLIANPASANTTVNNLAPGVNVFRWSINNSCGNTSDEVNINLNVINPISLGNDTIICPPATINLSGPASGISNYLWSDGSTGNSLLVTIPGTYWLQVQTADGCTFRDSILIYVCVSNNSLKIENDYSLVPNPVNGPVFLKASGTHIRDSKISLLDATGRTIWEESTAIKSGLNLLPLPATLPKGLYIIRFNEEGEIPVQLRMIRE
jgi:hypothetical protein